MTTTIRPTGHQQVQDRGPAPTGERSDERTGELRVGTSVEVRSRFDRRWSRGFAVDAVDDATYRLRRVSDGAVLPVRFPAEDVRPARSA